MKRTLMLSALIVAGTIPAMAADLPVKAPPPIAAPILIWNGFYAGFNGGYSFGRSSRELNFVTPAGGAVEERDGTVPACASIIQASCQPGVGLFVLHFQ